MCTPLQTLYSLGPVGWKCEEANCSPPIEKITKMVQYRMPIDAILLSCPEFHTLKFRPKNWPVENVLL